jgi:metal-responsive CopG/Arc/MetJ family transcriptional regulator
MANIFDHPGRGRPKKESTMDSLSLRIPDKLAGEIDDYAARLQEELPLLTISRADAIRQLIAVGIQQEQKRLKYKGK